jgi:hypothetical protein
MKHKTSHILFGYWNELRAGRLAPRRLEIEPARISSILAETFILERVNCSTYAFRLAGTRLCEQFGYELRGTSFLDGWSEADRKILIRQLGTLCERGAALLLALDAGDAYRLELEAVLLPLLHTGNAVTRIVGTMSAERSPPWLGTERLVSKRLLAHELIWPDGHPAFPPRASDALAPTLGDLASARIVKIDGRQFRVLDGGGDSSARDKG